MPQRAPGNVVNKPRTMAHNVRKPFKRLVIFLLLFLQKGLPKKKEKKKARKKWLRARGALGCPLMRRFLTPIGSSLDLKGCRMPGLIALGRNTSIIGSACPASEAPS